MAKTKTLKARTLMSLRCKIDDARAEGWRVRGEYYHCNGDYCILVAKDGN